MMKQYNRTYNVLEKQLRARVIKRHLQMLNTNKCICFSSGNSAGELIRAGLEVTAVGDDFSLTPNHWFTFTEIAWKFNNLFDATSGHLPLPLMQEVAKDFNYYARTNLFNLPQAIDLPTGSGETLVVIKLAFPKTKITAVYDIDPATEYNENAPLNGLVELLADKIIYEDFKRTGK